MKTHCESAKNQIGLPNTTIFDILFKISCRKRRSQLLSLDALFYARKCTKICLQHSSDPQLDFRHKNVESQGRAPSGGLKTKPLVATKKLKIAYVGKVFCAPTAGVRKMQKKQPRNAQGEFTALSRPPSL